MSNVIRTLPEPKFDLFQVCTELDNHYSMNDKDLAEFIIDLAQKHADLEVRTTSTCQFTYFDSSQAFYQLHTSQAYQF